MFGVNFAYTSIAVSNHPKSGFLVHSMEKVKLNVAIAGEPSHENNLSAS